MNKSSSLFIIENEKESNFINKTFTIKTIKFSLSILTAKLIIVIIVKYIKKKAMLNQPGKSVRNKINETDKIFVKRIIYKEKKKKR